LAIHVYERKNNKAHLRIHSHGDAIIKGVYMNTTHILTKFPVPAETSHYTLVLSQTGIQVPFNYTIKVFSMSVFRFNELPFYQHTQKIYSNWDWESSGGNITCPGFFLNPQFKLSISKPTATKTHCVITVSSPQNFPIGLVVFKSGTLIDTLTKTNLIIKSDVYKVNFNSVLCSFDAECYTVIPSSYEPDMAGDFTVTVYCDFPITIQPTGKEGEGMFRKILNGTWEKKYITCVTESVNSTYLLELQTNTKLRIRLRPMGPHRNKVPCRVEVVKKGDTNSMVSSGPLSISFQGVVLEHRFELQRTKPGTRTAMATMKPQEFHIQIQGEIMVTTDFELIVYHDNDIVLTESTTYY